MGYWSPDFLAYISGFLKYMKYQWLIKSNIDRIQNIHVTLTLFSVVSLMPAFTMSASPIAQPMAQVYQARRNCKQTTATSDRWYHTENSPGSLADA